MKQLLIILAFPFIGFTQSIKEANSYFSMRDYTTAILKYEQILQKSKKNTLDITATKNLADSYFYTNRFQAADSIYQHIYQLEGLQMNESQFNRWLSAQRSLEKYEEAYTLALTFYHDNLSKREQLIVQKATLDTSATTVVQVINVNFNTQHSEFGAAIIGNQLVFNTDSQTNTNGENYYTILSTELDTATGKYSTPVSFPSNIATDYNDASITFLADGKTVIFSRNNLKKRSKLEAKDGECATVQLYKGEIINNKIDRIKALSFVNKKYNYAHPFITSDGKYLLFTSDMPGGYGSTDIYISKITANGDISEPLNLGPAINTAGNEMFPTMYGDTLYFSSNGHIGLGGLDLYKAIAATENEFDAITNLGSPFNSTEDDFMLLIKDAQTGYFSSDRKGGKGNDDVYFYQLDLNNKTVNYAGLVESKTDHSPIANVLINVVDENNQVLVSTITNEMGNFNIEIPKEQPIKLVFSKENYTTEKVHLTIPKDVKKVDETSVSLTSFESLIEKDNGIEKIKIDPIYFDYNRSEITRQAEDELAKVIYAMENFPSIRIKIEAHTDSRGNDNYNLKLSDNRAKATMRYLIEKGIDATRIQSAIGYGETKPINKCKNGIKCTEEEYFINRRSDFIIISK